MNQPTDRMLIDALAILLADMYGLTDRRHGENARFYAKAREIVGHYAPMAISRMLREQDLEPRCPIDERTTPEELAGRGERGYMVRAEDFTAVESPELTDEQLAKLQPAQQRPDMRIGKLERRMVMRLTLLTTVPVFWSGSRGVLEIDQMRDEEVYEYLETAFRGRAVLDLSLEHFAPDELAAWPRYWEVNAKIEQPNSVWRFTLKPYAFD